MEHRDVANLQTLAAQVQELRETVAAQQEVLAALQRQEEMATPRVQVEREHAAPEGAPIEVAEATPVEASECGAPKPTKRGRRALLKGAGAMAATAATVALAAGEHQTAHAASAADGYYLVIGTANTETNTTSLEVSSGSNTTLAISNTGGGFGATFSGGNDKVGVRGSVGGTGGIGVSGSATGFFSIGVAGYNDTGTAIQGSSASGIDLNAAGSGRIYQKLKSFYGPPGSGYHYTGEMIRDAAGELWLCIADGPPGTWVQAAHAHAGYHGGAVSYLSKPMRLLDSRPGASDALNNGGGPYTFGGSPYSLPVAGAVYNGVGLPEILGGVIGNVTVVASSGGPGYVALVPFGAGFSGTSNINYVANQTIANFFAVALSLGKLDIYIGGADTDVIIDIFGFVS